uniref:MYC proto-onco, bHLH transcription factor n=1 Tax=Mandrillus leucophaeus TaxID=9568 RepID=A0A2K5YPL5_MANLE
MRGSARRRTPELCCSRPPLPGPGSPWLPSCLEKGRASQRLGGKKNGGRDPPVFGALSNSLERAGRRGWKIRASRAALRASWEGRYGAKRGLRLRPSPPADPPDSGPQPLPHPRNFAHSRGRALCTGTYNTLARTLLSRRGEAILPIWGHFPAAARTRSSERLSLPLFGRWIFFR